MRTLMSAMSLITPPLLPKGGLHAIRGVSSSFASEYRGH